MTDSRTPPKPRIRPSQMDSFMTHVRSMESMQSPRFNGSSKCAAALPRIAIGIRSGSPHDGGGKASTKAMAVACARIHRSS